MLVAPSEPQDAPGCPAEAVPIGTVNAAAVMTAPMIAFLSLATSLPFPFSWPTGEPGERFTLRARLPVDVGSAAGGGLDDHRRTSRGARAAWHRAQLQGLAAGSRAPHA